MEAAFIGNVIETTQGVFCIDPGDKHVSEELAKTSRYGVAELNRLAQFVNPSCRLLMLGGHVGSLCVPLSRLVKEIVVFEANPKTFRLLKMNLLLNGCSNVTAYNLAANDTSGVLEFVLNTHNSGGSKRTPKIRAPGYFYDNPEITTVPCVKLDDFLLHQTFDVIFMDIEGSEYFALMGMERLLSQTNALFVEFVPHHLQAVACISVHQFLEPLQDFKTFIIPSKATVKYDIQSFEEVLSQMMINNETDNGLLLLKAKVNIV